ncbi:hypothetical protein CBL_01808 [Carabus blaptoides fortunei]
MRRSRKRKSQRLFRALRSPPPPFAQQAPFPDFDISGILTALGGPYISKTKRIIHLFRGHHTLNLSILSMLKQKPVDKIRALSLARKNVANSVPWMEENFTFLIVRTGDPVAEHSSTPSSIVLRVLRALPTK